LSVVEILRALEKAPTGMLEDRFIALAGKIASLPGADFVDGLVHVNDDVKPVEDMHRLAGQLGVTSR
jgi:hypothetical protein